MSQCRSPLAIQSSIPVMSVGTLLLHFIAISLSSLSLFFFVVDFFLFVESEGRKSTARTKPNALQKKKKGARNDVSIFLALLLRPERGESLVREDVEKNMWKSLVCVSYDERKCM